MQSFVVSALISRAMGHGWISKPVSRGVLGCNPNSGYFCEAHQATMNACDLPCHGCKPYPQPDGNCTAGAYPGVATPKEPFCNPDQMPGTSFLEKAGKVQASWSAGETVEVSWVVS